MIRRRANHLTSRVIPRLDQSRQIESPPQPRQLILVGHRDPQWNDRSQLSYRHSRPLPVRAPPIARVREYARSIAARSAAAPGCTYT